MIIFVIILISYISLFLELGTPAVINKLDPKCIETSIPPDSSDEMLRCMNLDVSLISYLCLLSDNDCYLY